jgi:hypothetical protein
MLFVTNRWAECTIEKSINGMEFGAQFSFLLQG